MRKMFSDDDLAAMTRLREAFNPTNLLSPDKMLPTAGGCGTKQKHPKRRAAMLHRPFKYRWSWRLGLGCEIVNFCPAD